MDAKRFILSYYKNAEAGIHIQKIENSEEAKKLHSHGYFQIYYVSHGLLTHVTESESANLSRGDCFIIPPERPHKIGELEQSVFYTFSFTKESLVKDANTARLVSNFLQKVESESIVRSKLSLKDEDVLFVESILERMKEEFNKKPIGYDDNLRSYATIFITLLARRYFEKQPLTIEVSDTRAQVLHSIEYINQNFNEQITLSDMTRWTATSKTAFCKNFFMITGKTFNSYLNEVRIKHACSLIKKGYKISAIYGLCGYSDFSTFYRNFIKVMGYSPKKYKQK